MPQFAEPEVPPPAPVDIPEEATQIAPADVRIIQTPQGPARIEEYRNNGRVYMVRVTPSFGPAYFLVDTDGDGRLDQRRTGGVEEVMPTMWRLFSW
ncbi:MAG: DUF2782 domain-containing protein [Chromatiales bacterium]|nr:DUF2782 domain-containing protein [Gammaproteobacteria bacterium]MCP5353026.1 DUF2782 domain-containing protein [Chromatiales bacterium]